MLKKILLIVSPVSRPSWVKRYIPAIVDVLQGAGISVEKSLTQEPGDPERMAHEGKERFDAVLMAGGDGSINEVMNGLRGSTTPVGILPFGSVNVFAREMGIPFHPLAAARALLRSREKTFDMGKLGERHFLLMASFGFDAVALRRNPRFLKQAFGRYSYVITAFLLFPFYRTLSLEVCVDGKEDAQRACFAIFSNSKRYAGEYLVAPEADMQDGLLDVTLFDYPGRVGAVKIFLSFLRGNYLNKPWVKKKKAKTVRFSTPTLDNFQIDGDPIRPSSNEISIAQGAIKVLVPEGTPP